MRRSNAFAVCAVLALSARVAPAAPTLAPAPVVITRASISSNGQYRLSSLATGARIAVRLTYTRSGHTDVDGAAWSYSISYLVGTAPYQLELHVGGGQPSVYEAVQFHTSAADHFDITVQSVNASPSTPADIVLSLEQAGEVVQAFDAGRKPGNVAIQSNGAVSWTTVPGAVGYEVQWVFVDAQDSGAGQPFRDRPTATVEVRDTSARVSLAYPVGKVYVRVRAIGTFAGSATVRRGAWSNQAQYQINDAVALDQGRNWWRTTSFDNQATSRTVTRHYDSLLRERQHLSASEPGGVTRVSETVLDDEGRAALSTLSVPVQGAALGYRSSFTTTVTGGSLSSADLRQTIPAALAPAGAGEYFRVGHGVVGVPEEDRPYSTNTYARDTHGRIRTAAGVGSVLHQHPMQSLVGTAGAEFEQLFGATAGLAANYTRTVSVDANQQGHVQYTDPDGRLIATGLVGQTPSALTGLPENPFTTGQAQTVQVAIDIPRATLDATRRSDEYVQTLVNTALTTYEFDYSLSGATSTVTLGDSQVVCPHCIYNVTFVVYGPEGDVLQCASNAASTCVEVAAGTASATTSPAIYSMTVGPPDAACTNGGQLQFTIQLSQLGEYKVVRRVELDVSAVTTYTDSHSDVIPGVPDDDDIRETVDSYASSACSLDKCDSPECREMVRQAAERECDALETLARLDKQEEAAANGTDAAAAAAYQCTSGLLEVLPNEPAACCHVRVCRSSVNYTVEERLWEMGLASLPDWATANAKGMLDPVSFGTSAPAKLPVGIVPCRGALIGDCWDPLFRNNAPWVADIRKRMLEYKVDRWTGAVLNIWEYFQRPQLGLNPAEQWSLFRAAYLSLRDQLVVRDHNPACPYNEDVPAPDVGAFSLTAEPEQANASDDAQAAVDALAAQCSQQCQANVCNWRWQVADACSSYTAFDSNGDGAYDYPPYICDASTPIDDVHDHLLNYCVRQCGLENPLGSISSADLLTDPDLVAAQRVAGCSLAGIAGGVFESNLVCKEQCGTTLTECGETLAWYLANRQRRSTDKSDFAEELKHHTETCDDLQSMEEQKGALVTKRCRVWLVDDRGREVSIEQVVGDTAATGALPRTLEAALRSYFTGIVVRLRNGRPGYVLSDCRAMFTAVNGESCTETANKPTSKAASDKATVQSEVSKRSARIDPSDSLRPDLCSDELLSRIASIIGPSRGSPKAVWECTTAVRAHKESIEIARAKKDFCWFVFLTGRDAHPWLITENWQIAAAEQVALPRRYPASFRSADRSDLTLTFTGVRLTLLGRSGTTVEVYVYGSCPLSAGLSCQPIAGDIQLTLPDFDFDGWADQCEADAEAFNDAQTSRILNEGRDEAVETFTTVLSAQCMGGELSETLTLKYNVAEYSHTLFYYDQVGNVTAVVPPEGVKPLTADGNGQFNQAGSPQHEMLSRYWYDSRNNIVKRETADGGDARFIHDVRGRKRFSQTAEQSTRQEWSYAKYDALDRNVETGVIAPKTEAEVTALADQATLPQDNDPQRSNVIVTRYGPDLRADPQDGDRVANGTATELYLRGHVRDIFAQDSNTRVSYGYSPAGQISLLTTTQPGLGTKVARYGHDVVDDALLAVGYQVNDNGTRNVDEFRQRYDYDSERRVVTASSSIDGVIWERDGRFEYYAHGPAKRTILGEDEVQGIDYVSTVHGWPKSVNAGDASSGRDPGGDGTAGGPNDRIPQDMIGVLFSYFSGDFAPASQSFLSNGTGSGANLSQSGSDVFTGIIANRAVTNRGLVSLSVPTRTRYEYDQLARLLSATTATDTAGASAFDNAYSYDKNGNILSISRAGGAGANCSGNYDQLHYMYAVGTNRLIHINDDNANKSMCATDIDDQGAYNPLTSTAPSNYQYDADGRLVADAAEGITRIDWSSTNKIVDIYKGASSAIHLSYDGVDRRSRKVAGTSTTYYVRHPDGRVLATYVMAGTTGTPTLRDVNLYAGPKRLGTRLAYAPPTSGTFERVRGMTSYELTDQIGDVLAIVGDYKIGHDADADGIAEFYDANLLSAADYYPFGMLKPGLLQGASNASRFGFAGYEKDDEVKGYDSQGSLMLPASSYATESRFYDPRVGRWLSPDGVMLSDPRRMVSRPIEINPYAYALNSPENGYDRSGTETIVLVARSDYAGINFADHVALWVSNQGKPILFDPSGSFRAFEGEGGRGSSAIFRDPAALRDWLGFQLKSPGGKVESFIFSTTPQEEKALVARILNFNNPESDPEGGSDPRGLECAASCSSVLSGVGPFMDLEPTSLPHRLRDRVETLEERVREQRTQQLRPADKGTSSPRKLPSRPTEPRQEKPLEPTQKPKN